MQIYEMPAASYIQSVRNGYPHNHEFVGSAAGILKVKQLIRRQNLFQSDTI